MKKQVWLTMLMTWAACNSVQAHTHLHQSEPANNSTLTTAPKTLQLEFESAVQVTAVTLQQGDAAAHALSPLPQQAATQISVPIAESLTPGHYTVKWRAVGSDGHVMSGSIAFTLAK